MSRKNGNREEPGAAEVPGIRAIEEHAKAAGVSAPVFAAVKRARGRAAGKKVEKGEFEKAVNGFLSAPIGGV
ncbi:MAG: hypothetical protein LBC88_05555 [Spirochaetaceae bacterium]|jgi:hypothetical protein|nr:hypothetical protein [Spirochaetaceae bacterium]